MTREVLEQDPNDSLTSNCAVIDISLEMSHVRVEVSVPSDVPDVVSILCILPYEWP